MASTIKRIPSDEEINLSLRRFGDSPWRTIFVRMLLFGLRPHEACLGYVDDQGLFYVPPDTKTGERLVPCFDRRPEWVKLLKGETPRINVHENRQYGVRVNLAFRRHDIPFSPYCLRHRYVVLSEEQGIPPGVAAAWAGHSCKTRYTVYMKTLDQRRAIAYAHQHGYTLS